MGEKAETLLEYHKLPEVLVFGETALDAKEIHWHFRLTRYLPGLSSYLSATPHLAVVHFEVLAKYCPRGQQFSHRVYHLQLDYD